MVFQAIDLLARTTNGEEFPVEKKIVVIGGGNVAMDIARTLARKQKVKYGAVDLVVTSLETRDIMPADEEEIVESTEEGIVFHPGRGPEEIVIEKGAIKGLKTSRCTRVFDEEGRFSPAFDKDDIETYECSMVVEAIGQAPDMSYLGDYEKKVEYDGRRIKVDRYYQSSLPWLFVVGDIIKGPDVINGVATGHKAALGVDYFLTHREPEAVTTIDGVLRIARAYQESQIEQVTAAVAAVESGVAGTVASGDGSSLDGATSLLADLRYLLDTEKRALTKLDELLTNTNSRIHLRQELSREQTSADFVGITGLDAIDTRNAETIVATLVGRLRAAFSFYSDVLHLSGNKELEFTIELLRDRNETCYEKFIARQDAAASA